MEQGIDHVSYAENRAVVEGLRPGSPEDRLTVAGDVGEWMADIAWALSVLRGRFAQVVRVPGNHELWTVEEESGRLRGVARYEELLAMCRFLGVLTPEDHARVGTIGIDAEPNAALPDGVLDAIARPEELVAPAALPASAGVAWDRILFSAKESVYKAWFPLARKWLDFEEATVAIHRDGTFSARILIPGPHLLGKQLTGFAGRWAATGNHVFTSIVVERNV